MSSHPAALRGDELLLCHAPLSCISWSSSWASAPWIEHTGDAAGIAGGQVVSSMTGTCYFTPDNLLSLILLFVSIPVCWTGLKHPGKAACVAKETHVTPRQGWRWVQVTPACQFLQQCWWQPWSICRLCSPKSQPAYTWSGLAKEAGRIGSGREIRLHCSSIYLIS